VTTVLYRGPFQGRRVRFLLDSLAAARTPIDFVWLNPGYRDGSSGVGEKLRAERPFVGRADEVDGSWRAFPRVMEMLRRTVPRHDDVLGIGFTSLAYARAVRPAHLLWAVNGIPEERLLYDASARSRALVSAMWGAARIGPRPDLTIVVSAPMGRLVERRMPGSRWAKAPTSVDREVFRPPATGARSSMVYVGSGAPWQGVEVLAPIWTELHRRDPSLRFLVVSRDERARALLRDIPDSHATMTAAESPAEVAASLADAELAFLVRLPDVVNEASFPTKFGEYVASGVPVVTTDVGWDVADIIRRTGCGLLVDPFGDPAGTADEILRFRATVAADPTASRAACSRAADELSREHWLASLSAELVTVLGSPAAATVASAP
jgi:glycosyltransferase involved in cell wall biosynthesis